MVAEGYENLAPYYSTLFPVSQDLKDSLLDSLVPSLVRRNLPLLDVGCGTGNLLAWLREQRVEAFGLDPDPEFVAEARRRLVDGDRRISIGGFDQMGEHPRRKPHGAVTCLGNVLPHAKSLAQVQQFVRAAARLLDPDLGVLLIQTVNYDAVLAAGRWEFPALRRIASDGTPLEFTRNYDLEGWREGGRLRFDTTLRVGADPQARVVRNSTTLLPIRRAQIEAAVGEAFAGVLVCGNFRPWKPGTIVDQPWREAAGNWRADGPATIIMAWGPRPTAP